MKRITTYATVQLKEFELPHMLQRLSVNLTVSLLILPCHLATVLYSEAVEPPSKADVGEPPSKKAKKSSSTHLKKGKHKAKMEEIVSDSRLASYGIKKKK